MEERSYLGSFERSQAASSLDLELVKFKLPSSLGSSQSNLKGELLEVKTDSYTTIVKDLVG